MPPPALPAPRSERLPSELGAPKPAVAPRSLPTLRPPSGSKIARHSVAIVVGDVHQSKLSSASRDMWPVSRGPPSLTSVHCRHGASATVGATGLLRLLAPLSCRHPHAP